MNKLIFYEENNLAVLYNRYTDS